MFKFLTFENQHFMNLAVHYLSCLTRQTPSIMSRQNHKLLIFNAR